MAFEGRHNTISSKIWWIFAYSTAEEPLGDVLSNDSYTHVTTPHTAPNRGGNHLPAGPSAAVRLLSDPAERSCCSTSTGQTSKMCLPGLNIGPMVSNRLDAGSLVKADLSTAMEPWNILNSSQPSPFTSFHSAWRCWPLSNLIYLVDR